MKPLPIGKHTFVDIRHNNMLYVDKTDYLHRLITRGSAYFLSRPRRFGKSLLLSTLEAIFLGKRELFDGLSISQTDYNWDTFPVLHFDMSKLDAASVDTLKNTLLLALEKTAGMYDVQLDRRGGLQFAFATLIETIHAKHGKVVVLIDEYDKPISEHLTNIPLAIAMRDTLSDFYTILKSSDQYMRFVLLTGVSKFAKAGVFSKLNHLLDLSMDPRYAALCGYTHDELLASFPQHIEQLALKEQTSYDVIIEKIRHWYNGYRFTIADVRVYNPFSTLLLFEQGTFKNHWFETGTPKLLIDMIKETHYDLETIAKTPVMESAFSTYELEHLDLAALLFQAGYLTIDSYQPDRMLYQLKFPNFEVENSFFDYLLRTYTQDSTLSGSPMWTLVDALQSNDLTLFFETLNRFFAKIPYDIQIKHERYYQSIFYIIFTLLKLKITAEVRTNTGRIDAMVETPNTIFLFEFKVDDTAENALAQINQKGYAFPFSDTTKPIQKVGVSFSSNDRNVGNWVSQVLR